MPHQSIYLGYVIYTYTDLRNRPEPLFQLLSLLNQQLGGRFLNIVRANKVASSGSDANQFIQIDKRDLYEGLEAGAISRFQAHDEEVLRKSSILLRMVISDPADDDTQSCLFLAFPIEQITASPYPIAERGLETAIKAFELLKGVYGYANAGTLMGYSGSLEDTQIPFALGLVDYGQLFATQSISDEIPGVYWANLLSKQQVDRIGGVGKVLTSIDCHRKEVLGNGGAVLVLCPDPFAKSGELEATVLESMVGLLEDSAQGVSSRDLETKGSTPARDVELYLEYQQTGLQTLEQHVQEFDENYLRIGKVPRNHVWRPYRFCTQDVVLGLTVVCHSPDRNRLEVDVCLTSDIPEYEDGSGARVMASFLLSEAYKCGGSMEINFTDNVEGGSVPLALTELAKQYQIQLSHVTEGRISPSESRYLYTAVTEFSPSLRRKIEDLTSKGRLSQEKACYVVQRGIWTKMELEHIIFGSLRADAILGGEALPEQRQVYLNDISHARAAVMGGFLDRKMAKRQRGDEDEAVDLEDDVRPLDIDFDEDHYAKVYRSSEDLPIPWVANASSDLPLVPSGSQVVILVRARDAIDLSRQLPGDLALAGKVSETIVPHDPQSLIGILVPRDFEDLHEPDKENLLAAAQRLGIYILVCPETSTALNTDAIRRLATSRITRE